MRILFWGTPEFSVTVAEALSTTHTLVGIVSRPDAPQGRGRALTPPPLARWAVERGVLLFQPPDLTDTNFAEQLKALQPELNVVVAFVRLPESLVQLPSLGSVNLHASLLPELRGAAPIQWAILNGFTRTGISIIHLAPRIDTGEILAQRPVDIAATETAGDLAEKLCHVGTDLLLECLTGIAAGTSKPIPQPVGEFTKAPKLSSAIGTVDWGYPAWLLHDLVRGLTPEPGAYSVHAGVRMALAGTKPVENTLDLAPGEAVCLGDGLEIGCVEGALRVASLRPAGKKDMPGIAWWCGSIRDRQRRIRFDSLPNPALNALYQRRLTRNSDGGRGTRDDKPL